MTDFSTPAAVNDVDIAFPARALAIMPDYDDIPDEFKDHNNGWVEFANCWFNHGLDSKFSFEPKEHLSGEGERIWRHLQVVMGSYAPKHEHKIAAVAYLSNLWMESLLYGPADPSGDANWDDMEAVGEAHVDDWQNFFDNQGERNILGEQA